MFDKSSNLCHGVIWKAIRRASWELRLPRHTSASNRSSLYMYPTARELVKAVMLQNGVVKASERKGSKRLIYPQSSTRLWNNFNLSRDNTSPLWDGIHNLQRSGRRLSAQQARRSSGGRPARLSGEMFFALPVLRAEDNCVRWWRESCCCN